MTALKNRHKFIPLYLLSLFILPLMLSWLVYFFHAYFHLTTTHYGILVNPPLALETKFATQAKQRKWQIVFAPQQCHSEQTEKIVFQLHQLRKALGEDE